MSKLRAYVLIGCAVVFIALAGQLMYLNFFSRPSVSLAGAGASIPDEQITYSLIDDSGKSWTPDLLKGHPSLVYFGYTHCPDVCPTTLYEMATWFKTLGPQADGVKAYFFTVDPQRDTAPMMHTYISNFTDRITGVTGDPAEMEKAVNAWRIYAKKVPAPDGGDDYTMDHTASVMMVDPDGKLKSTISYGEDTNVALKKIQNLLTR
ncbi:protein SCO1/2 [Neorhizobium sp. 2083]|uniref:SCO family protein n=1 Tax=Neorhizobium sp. 2083 TaxID=2817762 RepID=UPI002857572E|nr:SCO family protein [Neorhizobium sp. 2083]MDR6820981.1 protein SCO1/2 [Neorhizobium sp. 2083]